MHHLSYRGCLGNGRYWLKVTVAFSVRKPLSELISCDVTLTTQPDWLLRVLRHSDVTGNWKATLVPWNFQSLVNEASPISDSISMGAFKVRVKRACWFQLRYDVRGILPYGPFLYIHLPGMFQGLRVFIKSCPGPNRKTLHFCMND